jgi:hypothetical protein
VHTHTMGRHALVSRSVPSQSAAGQEVAREPKFRAPAAHVAHERRWQLFYFMYFIAFENMDVFLLGHSLRSSATTKGRSQCVCAVVAEATWRSLPTRLPSRGFARSWRLPSSRLRSPRLVLWRLAIPNFENPISLSVYRVCWLSCICQLFLSVFKRFQGLCYHSLFLFAKTTQVRYIIISVVRANMVIAWL